MENFNSKGSPNGHHFDVEAGNRGTNDGFDDECDFSPFDISSTKNAPIERLRRWRQAALVLNASRRFRYTLDLKKEEEKKHIIRKIRTHAQVVRAANLFKEAGERAKVSQEYPGVPNGEYGLNNEELATMSKEHDLSALQQFGGLIGLGEKLKTNLEKGIAENDDDFLQRKNIFGSNTYPRKNGRNFLQFLWEACQDLTLVILMVAAVASLALGIKSEASWC